MHITTGTDLRTDQPQESNRGPLTVMFQQIACSSFRISSYFCRFQPQACVRLGDSKLTRRMSHSDGNANFKLEVKNIRGWLISGVEESPSD